MQAHRGAAGLPIGTTLLKIETNSLWKKAKQFSKASQKNKTKQPDLKHFHNYCFF